MKRLLICIFSIFLLNGCLVSKKDPQFNTTEYYKIFHKTKRWYFTPTKENFREAKREIYCAKVIRQVDSIHLVITKEQRFTGKQNEVLFQYSILEDTIVSNWQDVDRYFYRMFLFDKKVALMHIRRCGVKSNAIEHLTEKRHPSGDQIDFKMTSCTLIENIHCKGQIYRKKKSLILKLNQSFPVSGVFNGIFHDFKVCRINEKKYNKLKKNCM